MSVIDRLPQIDEYVPTKPLRYLGGAKEYAGRSRFYFSFPQFFMIAILFYFESRLIQAIFPNVWVWGAAIVVFGVAVAVFEYVFMHPAQIMYNRHQEARANRDPVYREVRRLHDRLDAIEGGRLAVPDGCGCTEIWERLSDQRRSADD